MGERKADTLREIDEIRRRIDRDLDDLGESLPPASDLKRMAVGALVGGMVLILGVWYLGRRVKVAREERRVKELLKDAIRELEGDRSSV